MTRAGLIHAGVPIAEVDFIGAEMKAAMDIFRGPHAEQLEERAQAEIKLDLPSHPLLLDAAAVTVRVARELAAEKGLPWPKREDFR